MGKRQHQKDKMYITCAEYTHFYGGKKSDIPQANFRRLSFDHCSLSLQPFEYPVCTPDGTVFDLLSIVPWIKKFGTNPITGEKLDAKSLVKLNFAKNNEGNYHCPVLFTVFTNNSHIVAIKTTGNVFAYEAVEQLNIKTKSYKDLLTDEPFTRQDILTLQDPTNLDKFNVSDFFHVKNNLKVTDPDEEKAKLDPSYYLKNTNLETRETLLELYKEFKGDDILAATMKAPEKRKVDKLNAAHYSTGTVSASFTSTAMAPETTHEAAAIEEDVVRYQYVKKKGYVRLHTNKGDLNLELHCDMTPRACENFIKLCKKNYYDGTVFHRSIRNFVIQGGDPTGTGTVRQKGPAEQFMCTEMSCESSIEILRKLSWVVCNPLLKFFGRSCLISPALSHATQQLLAAYNPGLQLALPSGLSLVENNASVQLLYLHMLMSDLG
ncbi:RING-type E3 ubiquitin-protein ligase PPIL2 isoform X6 [Lepidochelys kempii]|uniref:RING-type E3 ubiquitin-protein ligase PPIL2 isoform X6 n=1 Tax=Lepidochelys kempii TaxID=8472 RepID=UPI003C6EE3ED